MRFIFATVLLSFLIGPAFCQEGGYYQTHFSPQNPQINDVNFDIVQDQHGLICIANRSGVILFDGKSWELIKAPGAIFSLTIGANNIIYTGGVDGLGKVERGRNNKLQYISLTDSTHGEIRDVLMVGNSLYGASAKNIIKYNLKNGELKVIPSKYAGELYKLVIIDDQLHVISTIGGLKKIGEDALETPEIPALEGRQIEFISSPSPSGKQVVGFSDNKLSILENKQLSSVALQSDYLENSLGVSATWVGDSLIAIATFRGGIVFIDPVEQAIEQILDSKNGLPDNEIYTMMVDRSDGLWVAHNEGFTRISPKFPFKTFHKYPGLEGDILTVNHFNNRLYVGTTMGLFYLAQIREYEQKTDVEEIVITSAPLEKKERKGLFGFLRRPSEEAAPDTTTRIVKSTYQELKSIRYAYQKVSGISSKVFQLTSANGELYSGGFDGLFRITGDQVKQITDSPARTFHISRFYNKAFVNTYSNRFEVFNLNGSTHEKVNLLADFNDWVSHIFEDDKHRIWFCGSNDLFWIQLEGNEIKDADEYDIKNPYFFDTYGMVHKDRVLFINEAGIVEFNEKRNNLEQIEYPAYQKYFTDNNGTIWMLIDGKWKTLGTDISVDELDLVSVFKDVVYITYDKNHKNYWVVSDDNKLYRLNINQEAKSALKSSYKLFLQSIKSADSLITPKPKLKFDQDNTSLTFEFAQPEYSGLLETEYQYLLSGLNDEWSEWSTNHDVISIPYLPEGKYELKVKSRNLISGIQEAEPISFVVVPPYWKRPWFLAVEFSVLAFLLFISMRLKRLGYKYRMLSRLLALLTLIIIIEFIQTVAENEFGTESSPVFDFLIQITVAIIIFPVESVIRKFIFKEKNIQILDFISLKNKNT
ncbi:MAG: triple tyrosine motif-containing protein [Fulvivirga sp.]|nr:triple tyrosine motif-containing protein [Fulvivirga sp.]